MITESNNTNNSFIPFFILILILILAKIKKLIPTKGIIEKNKFFIFIFFIFILVIFMIYKNILPYLFKNSLLIFIIIYKVVLNWLFVLLIYNLIEYLVIKSNFDNKN